MLTFDLKQTPPSKGEKEAERVRLEWELAKNKRRRTLIIVLFFLIPMALIVASWQLGFVDGKTALIVAAVAAVVAFGGDVAVAFAAIGIGIFVNSLYECKTNLETRLASLCGLDKEEYYYCFAIRTLPIW